MQSELTGVSPNRSSQSPFQDQTRPSNHGLHHRDADSLGSSHLNRRSGLDEDSSEQRPDTGIHRNVSSSSSIDSRGRRYSPSSLSSSSAGRSGSSVDRIIEHEQANTRLVKKSKENTSYEILPRKGGAPGTPLTDFPNGPYVNITVAAGVLTFH